MSAPTVELAGGARLPRVGLGTWPMDEAEAERVVAEALGLGYRLVDTAHAYGNETGVGRGIRASGVPRGEVFVTTKLDAAWHGVREVRDAFAMSAGRLGVDYLDLFLVHWPNPWQDRYVAAWEGLLALHDEGLVRAVGVSNFKPAHLDRLLAATGVAPHVNQIELHPRLTRDGARAYHAERAIHTQSWSPLGRGRGLLCDPAVVAIAERHERSPAQIVLRWHVELGASPIPRSRNRERLLENLRIFDFSLSPEEVAALGALDRGEGEATHDSDEFGH